MAKYAKHFHNLAQELDLLDVTSPRQRANGTLEFYDPIASKIDVNVSYKVTRAGYIRRKTSSRWQENEYPLNPRRIWGTSSSMETLELVGMLFIAVTNYRKRKNA